MKISLFFFFLDVLFLLQDLIQGTILHLDAMFHQLALVSDSFSDFPCYFPGIPENDSRSGFV